jgi:hypothetical protein
MVDLSSFKKASPTGNKATTSSEEDPKVSKFKEAVREAEKSTLIFNLNLGKVPLINQDTMNTRVTMALSEMAASEEKKSGAIPSDDTASVIDDILSVTKGIKFFGRKTQTYRKAGDSRSGSFCTIPVRYDFHDKDSRIYAETTLRDKCKVQCTTPYPTILSNEPL